MIIKGLVIFFKLEIPSMTVAGWFDCKNLVKNS